MNANKKKTSQKSENIKNYDCEVWYEYTRKKIEIFLINYRKYRFMQKIENLCGILCEILIKWKFSCKKLNLRLEKGREKNTVDRNWDKKNLTKKIFYLNFSLL